MEVKPFKIIIMGEKMSKMSKIVETALEKKHREYMDNADKASLVASIREEGYGYIKTIHLNHHTAYRLLQECSYVC